MYGLKSPFLRSILKNSTAVQGIFKHYKKYSSVGIMDKRLVWVDCEMTGLDVDKCYLLEVACLVTDDQLNIVAEGPNVIIHQPDEILNTMNEWCIKQHGESGLSDRVRQSKISLKQAEDQLVSFLKKYTSPGSCPLAGNTVHMDKRFLDKYMPEFTEHLHYRIVDVSTLKELTRRWFPSDFESAPKKKGSHRAMDDIKESIEELRYYRTSIFKPVVESS